MVGVGIARHFKNRFDSDSEGQKSIKNDSSIIERLSILNDYRLIDSKTIIYDKTVSIDYFC